MFFATLVGTLVFTACGAAQKSGPSVAPSPARADAEARLEGLITELELDEGQAADFREINQRYSKELRKLRSAGDRQTTMAEAGKLRATRDREVTELLTNEQMARLIAIREREKAEMRARHRVRRPGGSGK